MITKLNTFETDYVDNQIETQLNPSGFYYEKKMMILESNWNSEDVFNDISVYPFLSNISNILGESQSIKVGHRNFDSLRGLKYYTQFPEGKIWTDPHCWGTSVFYIGSHGGTKSLLPTMDIVREPGMIDSFKGFESYPNILFFGSCGIFGGKDGDGFGLDLVGSSGTRGVFGYKSQFVGFLDSTITEILFLTRFFGIEGEDPFERLSWIYESVLKDFPPSKELGFSMYLR